MVTVCHILDDNSSTSAFFAMSHWTRQPVRSLVVAMAM